MVGQVAQSPQFQKASVEVKQLEKEPSNDEQLKLYSLFKIATCADFKAATVPAVYEFKASYKYNAWKKLVEAGMTPQAAQQQYVDYVEKELKPKYGWPKKS